MSNSAILEATHPSTTAQAAPRLSSISSSRLYRIEADLPAIGSPVKKPCVCTMCGTHLEPGDLAIYEDKDTFGNGFNNKPDLRIKSNMICGDCEGLWKPAMLGYYSKSVAIKGQGVYPLQKGEDIAPLILTPPTAPYVAVWNTRQLAHMIWRTSVQMPHPALITVRIDDDIMTINRDRVINGVRAWQYAKRRAKECKFKMLEPAFLCYKMNLAEVGLIFSNVAAFLQKDGPDSAKALATLRELSIADWWALGPVRGLDMDAPATWPKLMPMKVDLNSKKVDAEEAKE